MRAAGDAFAEHYNDARGAAWAEAVMNGATIDHGRFTMQVIEDRPDLLMAWLVEAGILRYDADHRTYYDLAETGYVKYERTEKGWETTFVEPTK